MQITQARYENGSLILSTTDQASRRLVYAFKPGEYELTKVTKKRSLDANSYCWILCTLIASAVGITKEEVYRGAIQEGNQYTQLELAPDALEAFQRIWGSKGIGWTIQAVDDTPEGNKLVFAYYGSSAYDTKQMSELIDNLVQDAKALDIDVLSDRELSLLKEEWHG